MPTNQTCQLKSGLFGCNGAQHGQCVYCGRNFCDKHGIVQPEGYEVCARKECDAKRVDVAAHLAYKTAALDSNAQSICGLEACDSAIEAQCHRCRAYFCKSHLDVREDIVTDEGAHLPAMVRMCRHCHTRRAIWLKT